MFRVIKMIFRTDLAKEACKGLENTDGLNSEEFFSYGVSGSRVRITSDGASKASGKRKGKYVSFETDAVITKNAEKYEDISRAIAGEIKTMIGNPDGAVLVAGLGNSNMTPDSVGPKTVEKILVTKHLFEFMPVLTDERIHPVCAIAPGVLGVTGIESADIIKGICKQNKIGAIIVVDALAARKSERMFSDFQITDAGIEPGAGVGNKRSALNKDTLGVPVIAVGVPTVVYATSLVFDAVLDILSSATGKEEDEISEAAMKIARIKVGDTVVTPKEVDTVTADSAKIIADGINLALHKGLSLEEINAYMA